MSSLRNDPQSTIFLLGEADGELYLVEREVDSQSSVERDSVAKDALIGLLTKVTGLRNVPRSLKIKEALNGPAAFYSGFSYKPNEGDGFLITYDFDKYLILDLINEAKLPYWWSVRPQSCYLAGFRSFSQGDPE